MDINIIGQGNATNIPYRIDSNLNSDINIKEIDKNESLNKEELDKALVKLNKFLEDEKAHAEYSVHKDLGTIMIKIVDDTTKDVIMEIPPKKILDMIAGMCKQFGLIDKKA
ncbi:flagellar protein FlaG [Clostridium weizhouense]|uniref:Flagellar protein FlaG n=1 Tax=Clostridium weizhouense TaxID=2859781 RepID=A0ABS7ALK9_9CLOT|nr:flagellar protein FlaG [Clostridium weizhouense]MBW6408586.1 flagellar protein FlaG [Clostridium weizhouense]